MEFSLDKFSVYILDGFRKDEAEALFDAKIEYFDRLSIDDVRNIKQMAETATSKIAFFINEVGFEAQNALLKITEEPPQNVYFVFLNKELLLDTLISRAQIIRKPSKRFTDDEIERLMNSDKEEIFSYIMQLKKDEILTFAEKLKDTLALKEEYRKLEKLSEMIADFKQFNLNEQLFLANVFDCIMEA